MNEERLEAYDNAVDRTREIRVLGLELYVERGREVDLLGAIARGWCALVNSAKEMDSDLATAIADQLEPFIATREAAAFVRGQEAMRERAAVSAETNRYLCDCGQAYGDCDAHATIAAAIRALEMA